MLVFLNFCYFFYIKSDILLWFPFKSLWLLLRTEHFFIHNNNLYFSFCELSLNFHSYFCFSCPSAAILIPNVRSRKFHHYPFLGFHLAKINIHRENECRRDLHFLSLQTLNQESDLHSCADFETVHAPLLRPLAPAKALRQIC